MGIRGIFLAVLLGLWGGAWAADPPFYARKATWHETLAASLDALARDAGTTGPRQPLPDLGRTPFTISAWVRTTAGGTILSKAPARGIWARQGRSFFVRGGHLCFDVGWVGVAEGSRPVADGQWHHVAVTRGNELRLYVDGQPDGAKTLDFQPDPPKDVFRIGYTSPNFPEKQSGFKGELDDVRLYARELSAADIQKVGSAGFSPSPGLVGHWPFDVDGSDASGCGNGVLDMADARLVEGKIGKAVQLDGTRGLLLPGGGQSPREAIWALVQRDFADADSRQQMAWEREDGIWDGAWPPVEDASATVGLPDRAPLTAGQASRGRLTGFAALAARYARAAQRAPALAAEAARLAAQAKDAPGLQAVRDLYLRSRRFGEAMARLGDLNLGGLRRAVEHLSDAFGAEYPQGRGFIARLDPFFISHHILLVMSFYP